MKKFALISKVKKPRLFINNNDVIIKMFSNEVGFVTLNQEIAKPFIDRGELIVLNGGAISEDPLTLTWYTRPEMPKYFQEIIKAIK
ncbi:MAG: hypothetical protein WA160_12270 [Pseudobdellovibrio sp.]